jgi:hypothetical protein
MRAKAFPGEDPLTLPAPEEVAPLFVDLALPSAALNGEVVSFKAWKQSRQSQTSNNDA